MQGFVAVRIRAQQRGPDAPLPNLPSTNRPPLRGRPPVNSPDGLITAGVVERIPLGVKISSRWSNSSVLCVGWYGCSS